MSLLLQKKIILLFLLISASLLSTSLAARPSKSLVREMDANTIYKETSNKALAEEDMSAIHERLLKANTKDYGRYDPSPALVRPPFKLIPN